MTFSEIDKEKRESFMNAFDMHTGGCSGRCECGRLFFDDSEDGGWDWNDGEREELQAKAKAGEATALDYGVGYVQFEGRQYAWDCDCWHQRAAVLIGFIDGHAREIAEYLNAEKKRLQAIADRAPKVD